MNVETIFVIKLMRCITRLGTHNVCQISHNEINCVYSCHTSDHKMCLMNNILCFVSQWIVFAKTLCLYIFAFKTFVNAYSFIFFIFLACWYLNYLVNSIQDKLCLLEYLNLYI